MEPAKLLTSADIEAMREKIKRASGTLILMAQNPANNHHWSKAVTEAERATWTEIFELAAMAARIREM